MIVDSSALLAVIFGEPDHHRYAAAMVDAAVLRISTANWLEAAMVIDSRRNAVATQRFEDLAAELAIELVPVTDRLARAARRAYQDFGRGNHPARLNFGDCLAYALAKTEGEPLLFKGADFSRTDIAPALPV